MQPDAVGVTLASLRGIFGIILALALGEAYKQVVVDTTSNPALKSVRWSSCVSLAAFLLLLIPFFHGMARFLDYAYQPELRHLAYGAFLLVDITGFTLEASLFFVMSRVLVPEQWQRFYLAVVGILVTDTAWGMFTVSVHHIQSVRPWLISNCVWLVVLVVILVALRPKKPIIGATVGLGIMLLRTVADYATSWDIYFPK